MDSLGPGASLTLCMRESNGQSKFKPNTNSPVLL